MKKKFFRRLVAALLLLYCIYIVIYISIRSDGYQWDFKTYYYAAKAYAAGLNPYNCNVLSQMTGASKYLEYPYPPVTLLLFRPFIAEDYKTASSLFLYFKCLLLAGLIYLWKRGFLKKEADLLFYILCLFAFNFVIYIDIRAGNINILEQFMIWLAFYFYLKRRQLLFCTFILIAASFRIMPVLFLFLLWFLEDKKKYIYFCSSVIIFLIYLVIQYASAPHLFTGFLNNALINLNYERGIVNPTTFTLTKDLFQILADKTGINVPNAFQLALVSVITITIILITRLAYIALKSANIKDKEKVILFLSCLVYALIQPRFKDYHYILLIVPAYFIMKRASYVKAYPFIFIITVLSSHDIAPPGFNASRYFLWEYYALITAYFVWGLYLYEIFICKNKLQQIHTTK